MITYRDENLQWLQPQQVNCTSVIYIQKHLLLPLVHKHLFWCTGKVSIVEIPNQCDYRINQTPNNNYAAVILCVNGFSFYKYNSVGFVVMT